MGTSVLSQQTNEKKSSQQTARKPPLALVYPDLPVEAGSDMIYGKKRFVDLLLGSLGFVGLMLIYPVIALCIKCSSRGPVLFKQARIGQSGNVFDCYKFRTMHLVKQLEKNGRPVVTKKGDNRIFAFGQFLRRYNIDELPQLLNVLKGEMSLVGPRPYHVKECMYWNGIFEDHHYRYIVPPGITGFAQARGYRGGTHDTEKMRKRLDNDLIYVEKNSLSLDLKIMYKTAYQMVIRDTKGH